MVVDGYIKLRFLPLFLFFFLHPPRGEPPSGFKGGNNPKFFFRFIKIFFLFEFSGFFHFGLGLNWLFNFIGVLSWEKAFFIYFFQ